MDKKLDRNGYAQSLFDTSCCYICGGPPEVRHEIFGGHRRTNSKAYGAWIALCVRHHEQIHAHPVEYGYLKENAQRAVQMAYKMDINQFRSLFGKNYREDVC